MQFLIWEPAFTFGSFSKITMDKVLAISNADVGYLDQLYQNYKKTPIQLTALAEVLPEGYDFSRQRGGNSHAGGASDSVSIKETGSKPWFSSIAHSVTWSRKPTRFVNGDLQRKSRL